MSNRNDFTNKDAAFTGTEGIILPVGTSEQRSLVPVIGTIRYNTTLGFSEQYSADGWAGIAPPPIISSISPTAFDGESGTTITINGSNFDATSSVQFILVGSIILNATVTTRISSGQLTATTPRDFLASESPASIRVTSGSGLSATIENVLTFAEVPLFATTSGSVGSIYDGSRSSTNHLSTLSATDGDGGTVVSYAVVDGSLPPGLTVNTSTAAITGTAVAVGSDTTSSFTVRATDNAGNTTDRVFNITVRAPVVQSFTAVGTTAFSVPIGVINARVVVIAGGGGGGTRDVGAGGAGTDGGSGGGAGGMIDYPAFPLTPGGAVSVTVGAGGAGGAQSGLPALSPGAQGSNSVFGSLTAIGGGFGGRGPLNPNPGGPGGSGGGEGGGGGTSGGVGARGVGVQPAQPGASGTFGYGFPGIENDAGSPHTGSGGGGAGGAPPTVGGAGRTSPGGAGRASDVTGSPVTRAGGGGGGSALGGNGGSGTGGGGTSPNSQGQNGNSGTTNTGGGGGGGPGGPGSGGAGGPGGPGVVIVRY